MDMSKVWVLGEDVLVKLEETPAKVGSILMPATVDKSQSNAVVLAVGKGRTLKNGMTVSSDIKVGEKVLVPMNTGREVDIDSIKYRVYTQDEVLAVLGE